MRIQRLETLLEALKQAPQYLGQDNVWSYYLAACIGESKPSNREDIANYIERYHQLKNAYCQGAVSSFTALNSISLTSQSIKKEVRQ